MNEELFLSLPLIIMSAMSVILVFIDAITGKNKTINYVLSVLTLLATGVSAGLTLMSSPHLSADQMMGAYTFSKNAITFGGYAALFDIIFCVGGLLTLLVAKNYITDQYKESKAFYSLILLSITGMMYIAHANHLLMLFIGVELMSILFYALAGYFKNRISSVEAALKYFLLGAFASGFLLYGIAMVYGATGSLYLNEMSSLIMNGHFNPVYYTIGMGLLFIGLAFKIAAFPFHQWAPDVYQGSPTVISGFMSTSGKAAAIIGFIVIAKSLMPATVSLLGINPSVQLLQTILAFIAAGTMLIGNITALVQKNVKRMLAYSSVAHAGYLLMGVVANNPDGWSGAMFYVTAYTFMQIGAFAIVAMIEGKDETRLELGDYAGLSKTQPVLAATMAMFMFSLAGIPPFAGFFGKYYLFMATVSAGYTWLTIVAVISSIISVYFYLGLIVQMYFKESEGTVFTPLAGLARVSLFLAAAGTVFFGLFPSILIEIGNILFR